MQQRCSICQLHLYRNRPVSQVVLFFCHHALMLAMQRRVWNMLVCNARPGLSGTDGEMFSVNLARGLDSTRTHQHTHTHDIPLLTTKHVCCGYLKNKDNRIMALNCFSWHVDNQVYPSGGQFQNASGADAQDAQADLLELVLCSTWLLHQYIGAASRRRPVGF